MPSLFTTLLFTTLLIVRVVQSFQLPDYATNTAESISLIITVFAYLGLTLFIKKQREWYVNVVYSFLIFAAVIALQTQTVFLISKVHPLVISRCLSSLCFLLSSIFLFRKLKQFHETKFETTLLAFVLYSLMHSVTRVLVFILYPILRINNNRYQGNMFESMITRSLPMLTQTLLTTLGFAALLFIVYSLRKWAERAESKKFPAS